MSNVVVLIYRGTVTIALIKSLELILIAISVWELLNHSGHFIDFPP